MRKEGGCEVVKEGGCCRQFIGKGHHFPTWYWYFAVNGTHRAVQRVTWGAGDCQQRSTGDDIAALEVHQLLEGLHVWIATVRLP